MAMRQIFRFYFIEEVRHRSLTQLLNPVRFRPRICGILLIENLSPLSTIGGVADSPYTWYGKLATPRITHTGSRPLYQLHGESSTLSIVDSVSHWGGGESPYHWYREVSTPRIVDTGSRRLRGLVIQGVTVHNQESIYWTFRKAQPCLSRKISAKM